MRKFSACFPQTEVPFIWKLKSVFFKQVDTPTSVLKSLRVNSFKAGVTFFTVAKKKDWNAVRAALVSSTLQPGNRFSSSVTVSGGELPINLLDTCTSVSCFLWLEIVVKTKVFRLPSCGPHLSSEQGFSRQQCYNFYGMSIVKGTQKYALGCNLLGQNMLQVHSSAGQTSKSSAPIMPLLFN